MRNNRKFTVDHKDFIHCAGNIRKKCCCISVGKCKEIKKIARILIYTGILAILILCFPPVVWFVIMAVGMIILGIRLIKC